MFNNTVDKNSREYLQRKVASSRHNLLLVVIFTVINLVLLLTEAGSYFLFSASVPYELTIIGAVMDLELVGAIGGTFTITALVISGIILFVYLLCWLLAKKHPAWYIVAAVLFALDTAAMVYINRDAAFMFYMDREYLGDIVIEIVFHAFVLFDLIQAILANRKLKAMPVEVLDVQGQVIDQSTLEPWERKDMQ